MTLVATSLIACNKNTDNAPKEEVKKELFEHPQIQSYYQSYYALNDLLEKVTEIIFQGISDELSFHQLTL